MKFITYIREEENWAMDAGVAPIISDEQLQHAIEKNFWKPEYRHYKRVAF